MKQFQLFLLVLVLFLRFSSGKSEKCMTIRNTVGDCKPIRDCHILKHVHPQTSINYFIEEYLESTKCGEHNTNACCERNTRSCFREDGRPGLCIPIRQCHSVLNFIDNRHFFSQDAYNYIRSSPCTHEGQRRICCPFSENMVPEIILPNPGECGVMSEDASDSNEEVYYPWLALLEYKDNNNTKIGCGGTLINDRYVLTSARCVKNVIEQIGELSTVLLGGHNLNNARSCLRRNNTCIHLESVKISPEKIFIHRNYNEETSSHDVALILLREKVNYSRSIQPICVYKFEKQLPDHVRVSGWGIAHKGNNKKKRHHAKFHVLNENGPTLSITNNKDECIGDEGGPIMIHDDTDKTKIFYQVGIMNYGKAGCRNNNKSEFISLRGYSQWIKRAMAP